MNVALLRSAVRRARFEPQPGPLAPSIVPTKPMTFLTVAEKISVIQKYVAIRHGVSLKRMLSSSRMREAVRARQLASYFAMSLLDCGGAEVARRLGGRDRGVVEHSVKTINRRMNDDLGFAHELGAMRADLVNQLKPRSA